MMRTIALGVVNRDAECDTALRRRHLCNDVFYSLAVLIIIVSMLAAAGPARRGLRIQPRKHCAKTDSFRDY